MQDTTPYDNLDWSHDAPSATRDATAAQRRATQRDQHLHRLPVVEAAELLGVTPSAVRKRVERGTLASDKEEDGRLFVYLDLTATDRDGGHTTPRDTSRQSHNTAHATGRDALHDTSNGPARDELIGELRSHMVGMEDQIQFLRAELERKDTLLMTLMQRVPELEAPREPRDGHETVSESAGKGKVHPEPQEPSQRRSWLYRFFFGP